MDRQLFMDSTAPIACHPTWHMSNFDIHLNFISTYVGEWPHVIFSFYVPCDSNRLL